MAVTFRAGATAFHASGSGSTLTVPVPTGTQDGDLMVMLVQVGGASNTPTAPGAWTVQDTQTTSPTSRTWSRVASSEPASYNLTVNNNSNSIAIVLSYSGVHGTTPLDAHTLLRQASGTGVAATGATPSVDDCMIVELAAISTASTWTAPATYTARTSLNNTWAVGGFEKLQTSAAATGTVTATATTGGTHNGALFVIRPPVASPTGAADLVGNGGLTASGEASGGSGATIAVVHADEGAVSSPSSPKATNSYAFQNNCLYVLTVSMRGGTTPDVTGVTGGGLTWTKTTTSYTAAAPFMAQYKALATSGATTGALSLTFTSNPSSFKWTLEEFSNVNTSTPIVQTAAMVHAANSNGSVTLSAFSDATHNMAYGVFATNQIESSVTADASGGWSELIEEVTSLTSAQTLYAEDKIGQDTTVTATFSSAAANLWTGNAIEILAGAGVTTKTGSAALTMATTQVGGSVGCYFGAYPGTEARGGTMSTAIAQIEADIQRPLAVIRTFRTTADSWPTANDLTVLSQGKTPFLSWKPTTYTWAQVAAGSADTYIDARAASLISNFAGAPFYFSFHHEMDGGSAAGYGTSAEFVAAWQHVIARLRTQGVTGMTTCVTYQNYTFSPGSGRDPDDWWPGSGTADLMGADGYNNTQQGNHTWQSVDTVFTLVNDWAETNNVNWCVPEIGCPEDLEIYHSPVDPNRKAAWLADVVTTFQSYPHFVGPFLYFDTYKASEFVNENWSSDSSATSLAGFVTMAADSYFFPVPATQVTGGVLSATGSISGGSFGQAINAYDNSRMIGSRNMYSSR